MTIDEIRSRTAPHDLVVLATVAVAEQLKRIADAVERAEARDRDGDEPEPPAEVSE